MYFSNQTVYLASFWSYMVALPIRIFLPPFENFCASKFMTEWPVEGVA